MKNLPYEEILKKAEAGDPDAQYTFGKMYYKGNSVKLGYTNAKEWYKKTVVQKHA